MRRVALFLAILSITVGCASAPEPEDPERPSPDRPAPDEVVDESQLDLVDLPEPEPHDEPREEAEAEAEETAPEFTGRREAPPAAEELIEPRAIGDPILPWLALPDPQSPETHPEVSSRRSPERDADDTGAALDPDELDDEPPELPTPQDPIALVVLEALPEPEAPEQAEQPEPAAEPEAEPEPLRADDALEEPEPTPTPPIEGDAAPAPEPEAEPAPEPEPTEDAAAVQPRDRERPAAIPEMPARRDSAERAQALELPEQHERVGEEFSVELPGSGWVYLGVENGRDRVEFVRRSGDDEQTEFVFRITEEGDFRLRFQRQDMTRGEIQDHELAVTASEDTTSADTDDRAQPDASEEPSEPPALAEVPTPGETETETEDDSERDLSGIPSEELLERAREAAENDEIGDAIALYERYLEHDNPGAERAHAHFMLGRLYERASEHRNLRRSREHYRTVVDEFPVSSYYRPAEQRVRYLDRHFFEIR